MGSILQGPFPQKLMRICTRYPAPLLGYMGTENRPALPGRKGAIMTIHDKIPESKPHRVNEMQVGDTLFTVISVESDRARERLYDKVKRMILNNENTETPTTPTAA